MDVLKKITLKNLKLNKKRTAVTIIGIILATALITGVTTLLDTFLSSYTTYIKEHSGNYHLKLSGVPYNDIDRIVNLENVESYFLTQNVGYSTYENEQTSFIVQIINFSEEAFQKLGIELIDGRLPQNSNEIVISNSIKQENIDIGSNISLDIEGEDTVKNYTIVGIVEILNQQIESVQNGYYTFISYLDTNNLNDNYNIYLRYSDLSKRVETLVDILKIDEEIYKEAKTTTVSETEMNLDNLLMDSEVKYIYEYNSSLIAIELGNDYDQTTLMLYVIAIIVLITIIIVSAYCIKNSFEISITEKVKQYGMLSSVGTTQRQIRRNVLYEAFVLGIIGIPIGIILGTGTIYILLKFVQINLVDELFGLELIFSTNIVAILFSIVFSALTIYLSARKSAKIASKITPIEAIKENRDIKIETKKIKPPKIIKKIFGVGGKHAMEIKQTYPKIIKKIFGIGGVIAYKNIKRNKRKYRTVVVSIVVSVTAFIALITFSNYALKTINLYYVSLDFNISIQGEYDKLLEIAQDSNIENYSLIRNNNLLIKNGKEHFSEDIKILKDYSYRFSYSSISITATGEQEYERFVNQLGLDYDSVKDKGILIDYITDYAEIDGKNKFVTVRTYDYQAGDVLKIYTFDDIYISPIEIATVTDEVPIGLDFNSIGPYLVVSDETFNKIIDKEKASEYNSVGEGLLNIVTEDSKELLEYIEENYSYNYSYIQNLDEWGTEQRVMITAVSIFLYAFIIVTSLVGITNIFNTVTTSIELRQKEFAHLKSMGMTKKEFSNMIRLENLFLSIKSLAIGILIGIIISYIIHIAFNTNIIMEYIFPLNGVVISIIVVCTILWGISIYALNKISKQNIIETIRRDNT